MTVPLDKTRTDIRHTFALWDIDPSEFEILWESELNLKAGRLAPGVQVRYLRRGKWQQISCYTFTTRAANLRQVFFLLERLRIAEQQGVQYEGLTFTTEVATTVDTERQKKEDLLDAYDILGASPDDPVELIKRVYNNKVLFYHPDKGGDPEKFKKLTAAYELILKSRGVK
ncbi:MAG: J domain-containing protein [bacterium]|nr:J domain-containing protein [bacterium]